MTAATEIENPLSRLSDEQIDGLAREFDAIYDRVRADLGERDRRYIEGMIELHRRLEATARALLLASDNPAARTAGTAILTAAKILENMEIGHNVLHGQWDWMNDPRIHSSTWDWDMTSTVEGWKQAHNYHHHTFANIRGKDRDLGYDIMRIDPQQKWYPFHLLQPFYNLLVAATFEWSMAVYDLNLMAVLSGEKSIAQAKREVAGVHEKVMRQVRKDYVAWPLLSGLASAAFELGLEAVGRRGRRRQGGLAASFRRALDKGARTAASTAIANATATVGRSIWMYAVIFCGHFPDQTYSFSPEEVEGETKGRWYVRQMLGAANIEGSLLFHIASGNLSHQVEHHLFPGIPSSRYAEISPEVKEICQRYGLPYNSGPFLQQLGMVQRTILRLAFPGGKPRPKREPCRE